MSRIFISYRREDSGIWAGRLADELRKHFPPEQVFQDIASIDPGADFREVLEQALATAATMLVIIGPHWLSAMDKKGRKRLESPADLVHQEVAESLRRPDVRVFPLLVDGAEMPAEEDLPEPLKPLAGRHAFELTVRHWANDVVQLVQTLKRAPGLAGIRAMDGVPARQTVEQETKGREAEERASKDEILGMQAKLTADEETRHRAEEETRRKAEEETRRKAPIGTPTSAAAAPIPRFSRGALAAMVSVASAVLLLGVYIYADRGQPERLAPLEEPPTAPARLAPVAEPETTPAAPTKGQSQTMSQLPSAPDDSGLREIRKRSFKFAHQNSKEHPQGLGVAQFAKLVAQKSGGKMRVQQFAGGALGGDLQNVSALQGGTVDFAVLNTELLVGLANEALIVNLPFLFNDSREAETIVDGPVGRAISDKVAEKGVIGLAYWELGFRDVTNSKRPIAKMEDIQGLKLRVVKTKLLFDLWSTLGANPVSVPFPEVYSQLEQRLVDGQENQVSVIAASRFNEVQKYLTLTRHIYEPQSVIVSKRVWDQLNAAERKVIQEAASEATTFQRRVSREQSANALEALKAAGMQVRELPPAELTRIREKIRPVLDKYRVRAGLGLARAVEAELAKMRGGK
ncbi:MAG: DctP family TRAP transporter solute-binding subunit [Casimicrobiaceae bacterium]